MTHTVQAILVTSDFPPNCTGGIQRYYYDLCCYADGAIAVVAPKPSAHSFDSRQTFRTWRVRVPMSQSVVARCFQAFGLVLRGLIQARSAGIKAIVFGHWYLALFGSLPCKLLRHPFGVVLHGGELNPYKSNAFMMWLVLTAVRSASTVIVNSEFTKTQYVQYGMPEARIRVLAPGVDVTRFQIAESSETVRTKLGLINAFVLLTVGTLVERKGHDTVIRALRQISARIPNVHYVIVGVGPNEPALRALAASEDVIDLVTFAGRVGDEEIAAYYAACDLFVMPSRLIASSSKGVEGFGIVYLEAACCQKPAIGGRGAGAEEAIVHGKTGLVVDPRSTEELAEAVIGLALDPSRREHYGLAGRERALNEFGWPAKVDKLLCALKGNASASCPVSY
jgi:phosphatidylinositol alpha-1,6-mannosyltransferase